MRYFLLFFIILSAHAVDDEVKKLMESTKARKEALKIFREKVSTDDGLCPVRDYQCFKEALSKIPGRHPEDIINARDLLEPFYLRSLKQGFPPCSESCEQNLRAQHIDLFLNYLNSYNDSELKKYGLDDSITVKGSRVRAYMDLSAFGNSQKHLLYLKEEYAKLDFKKVTLKGYKDKASYDKKFAEIENGKPFVESVLCHIPPGSNVYNSIIGKKEDPVHLTYRGWMLSFDENARKNCVDSTPMIYRGLDKSTRDYYGDITKVKLSAIDCKPGDYACVRTHFRNIEIHYAKDVLWVMGFLSTFSDKSKPKTCDETCKAQDLLRATQTLITFLSSFDRSKLAYTMDWNKYPEDKYWSITEDVEIYGAISSTFNFIITELGTIDPAKIKDQGLKSELRSIEKDVSNFASGKMLKDSVICTMDPWTAAYDKYMSPFKVAKANKAFEKAFFQFKENVCK